MSRLSRAAVLLGSFALLWGLGTWLGREIPRPEWADHFPDELWAGEPVTEIELSEAEAKVLGVDHYRFFEWRGAGPRVWLYVGYYAGQRSDAQVHAPEHCYPGTGWEIQSSRTREWEDARLKELRIRRHSNVRLVWYAYRTRLGAPTGAFGLKRDQVLAALLGRPRDALLVRLSTPVLEADGEEGARVRLERAWRAQASGVEDWFDREGGT